MRTTYFLSGLILGAASLALFRYAFYHADSSLSALFVPVVICFATVLISAINSDLDDLP